MTTVVQTATSDAYVVQNLPTYKNPQAKYLTVTGVGGGELRYAWVYFNRPFPLGVTVLSATLRLFQKGAATGGSRQLQVRRVAARWGESTIDYENQPSPAGASSNSASQGNGGTDGRVWEIDVTAHMQEIADGAAWYGFRIASTVPTLMFLFSSEADEYQPQLEIEFSDAPDAPSVLSPDNGRSVSIARPTLRFDFTDTAGDTSMEGYELQISTTNSFDESTPTPIAASTNIPQHLMTTDIVAATTYYWRVRVQDGAGVWSDWSEVASFTRTVKPTVVLDSPTTSVTESSPPVLWTVTGGTQTAYQLFVTDPADTAIVLWTSGKVSLADDSATLPIRTPPLLTPGGEYGLTLRIWDVVEREATPGDPIATDTSTVFTFDLSAGTDPVATIAATSYEGRPDVDITVTRASAPDEFLLLRDGTAVSTVDPADISTGGGTYVWHDVLVAPRVEHEWTVVAVVNGVASSSNPTATATTEPVGYWLMTLDGVHKIFISGEDAIQFESSELSAVRKPLGATNPVLRTQAIFGPDGSIDGYAKARRGQSYADVVAAWDAITDPQQYAPGAEIALTGVDTAARIVMYNVVRGDKAEYVDKFSIRARFFVVR